MKRQFIEQMEIPDLPGVYVFKVDEKILYIGKATSLRDRTRSYFGHDLIETRGPLIVDMVTKANGLSFETTGSVLEALVLEAALIKREQPYYNTKEKDDKSYYYVCITKGEHPLVILERGKNIDFKSLSTINYKLTTTFGPFPNGAMIREGMRILRRIFPFDDASSIAKNHRIFYEQLGLTPKDRNLEYKKSLQKLSLFLSGKVKKLTASLRSEMRSLANKGEFEKATLVRNQLFSLEHIRDVSLLKREYHHMQFNGKVFRIEAYDIAHLSGDSMVGGMTVIEDGEPLKSDYRKFIIRKVTSSNDPAALAEMIERRLSHTEWKMPDIIVVDGNIIQFNVAKRITKKFNLEIPIIAVTKNEKHKPKALVGDGDIVKKYRDALLLANAEVHRFVLSFHRNRRTKKLLGE